MKIFRKIKDFFIENSQIKIKTSSYNTTNDFIRVLDFNDGLISKSTNSFAKIGIKGDESGIAINNPDDAIVLFQKLENGDVITGRDGVYIHYSNQLKQLNLIATKLNIDINGNKINIDENGLSIIANKLDIDISGKKLTIDSKLKFDNKEVAVVGGTTATGGAITNSGQQ